jgi:single-strand DNA-binding protein
MARGFNKVVLMGNLARDPEIRYTVDKRAWASFSVAVNYSFKSKSGEIKDGVDFIPVVVWGSSAEFCARYFKKASFVLVEGKIRTRSYEAKDGSGKRYVTEVMADDVMFAGAKRTAEGDGYSGAASPVGGHSSFGEDADFGKSIREKGFGEEFPIDISEMGANEDGESEVEIPF